MSYLGLKFIIPNFYTYRSDRLTMANSVEARSPFLDVHFVNASLSIPPAFKMRGGEPKSILKKSLETTLSSDTLYRKKMGFSVPIREWGVEIMANTIDNHIDSFCDATDVFRADEIRSQVRDLRDGNQNYTMSLWVIYFLLQWSRKWLRL
jgi:asparagine synthase (glutamine-hydrolysing)